MPDYQDRMKDYVPVNERIASFMDEHPEGCLQSEIVELTDSRVTVKAYAYRTPADERPGVGHSSLNIPGSTPYTKGSEIENAETSAWGRAIAALGFEVKRGISSSEEIANKQPGRGTEGRTARGAQAPVAPPPAPVPYRRRELAELMAEKAIDHAAVEQYADLIGIPKDERPMSDASMDRLIDAVHGHGTEEPLELPLGGDEPPAEPPQPGSAAYRALDAMGKANARAHWAERP